MKWTNTGNLKSTEFNETLSYDETLGGTNLYTNGDFEFGNTYNFSKTLETADPQSGSYYITQDHYGGWQSGEMVPVDTSKNYNLSVWVKTFERSAEGSLAGGHIGFSCYDKNKKFIDLRNLGGVDPTYLTRDANPGDLELYVSDPFWYTGEDVTNINSGLRCVLFFPADHPDYNVPHGYTRLGYGDIYIKYRAMVQEGSEWKITLEQPLPDLGASTPAGTPIDRGHWGGTYNYAFGAPYYPETWTNYQRTIPANVLVRNSDYRFRPGTAYIKFLILGNYNIRSQAAPLAKFGIDNIALVCADDFQGNTSEKAVKAKQGADGKTYAQEFVEGTSADAAQLGLLSQDGQLTVNGEIIEE